MVNNVFIKCQICGCVTRIRLQVGFLEQHPIIVPCGKCKTSLSGRVFIGQDRPGLKYEFNNATILSNAEKYDYIVECSGEFPTDKHCDDENKVNPITPYIRILPLMKTDESYQNFSKVIHILNLTAKEWGKYKTIFDLYLNKSDYLVPELNKTFTKEIIECKDELDILKAVHLIELHLFHRALRQDVLNYVDFSLGILDLDKEQLKQMIAYLNTKPGFSLRELQSTIYKLENEFIEYYSYVIPAISLQYCKEDEIDYEKMGTSISSLEILKNYYQDLFEALGDLLIIPIALNNIKYRSNYDDCIANAHRIVTLNGFLNESKAHRYDLCSDNESYTNFLYVMTNNKLRNAIGHYNFEYDQFTQTITYYPNPKDKSKHASQYLLEMENEMVHMFQAVLEISEFLYRLRELEIDFDDTNNISIFKREYQNKRIGRNDKCPCGSGKKYKNCHGNIKFK